MLGCVEREPADLVAATVRTVWCYHQIGLLPIVGERTDAVTTTWRTWRGCSEPFERERGDAVRMDMEGRTNGDLAVEVRGLEKRFGGFAAVRGLDLRVRAGEVHGLLGPNGAGKTSTIRVLLGLYRASAGRVRVLGRDPGVEAAHINRHVSYVPGEVNLWPKLTGQEVLDALAGLRGARDAAAERRLVEDFALDTASWYGPTPRATGRR